MKQLHLASRIRSYRKKAGLSQKDLARLVGLTEARISYHERFGIMPPLVVALSYEAIFGIAVRDLYPRLFEDVKLLVETRVTQFEEELQQASANGPQAAITALKLEWCCERKKPIVTNLT